MSHVFLVFNSDREYVDAFSTLAAAKSFVEELLSGRTWQHYVGAFLNGDERWSYDWHDCDSDPPDGRWASYDVRVVTLR